MKISPILIMDKMKKIILTLLILVFASCVPTAGEGERTESNDTDLTNSSGSGTGSGIGDSGVDLDDDTINGFNWYTDQVITNALTIDANVTSPVYLRGGFVDTFLNQNSNSSTKFCLVANFPTSSPKTQLRILVSPFEFIQISTGKKEKLFRVEFPSRSDSTALCSGTINGVATASAAYHPEDLCSGTGCPGGIITATKSLPVNEVELYEVTSGSVTSTEEVSAFDFSSKTLRLNLNNTSSGSGTSAQCTESACKALGSNFCCLPSEGICAQDAAQRPNASSHTDFTRATAEVTADSNAYVRWPEIFFVCPNGSIGSGTGTGTGSSSDNQTFAEILADYECQEGDASKCDPDLATVTTRIQNVCCSGAGGSCTQFKYVAVTNPSGTITDIRCDDSNTQDKPFENQTVTLLSNSVPHRFFKADGTVVDDFDSLISTTDTQEGTAISYLDPTSKVGAQNGSFNMNSVLGNMNVNLSETRPAKVVTVEFDKTYIIGATSGIYIPCPLCTRDSWNQIFSAYPAIQSANGLTAVGFTTRRDSFETNTTGGNYGDTKFGRACFIPPTMIPFTHGTNATLQTQRLNRLEAQAALFINGYQRDWYGFNKGALIGSFDGVSWFAVGDGRRVRSTSTKLFLAINAPFGDLASSTSYSIDIVEENGNAITADYDYNPDLSDTHPEQNQAASCQKYHQCEVDSDCITQLGWEYMCADVSSLKTTWPKFSTDADETANATETKALTAILKGGITGPSNKRCVYRGMGSICKQAYDENIDSNKQKLVTCAPNFYCADLADSIYNSEVARDPSGIFNILFGMDTDVVGRPKTYLGAGQSLTATTQTQVKSNIQTYLNITDADGTVGLCMPGKRISSQNHIDQHKFKDDDAAQRSDYISQIGSCDHDFFSSAANTLHARTQGCPILDTDGDYIFTTAANFSTHRDKFYTQNACGGSHTNDSSVNVFANIEADAAGNITSLTQASHSESACLRRAGQVCHTDLDCSPSRLHSELAKQLGTTVFGSTEAEKKYWEEFLVCGQAQEKPAFGTPDFLNFSLKQNLCCRPQGLEITMETQLELLDGTADNDDETKPITSRWPAEAQNDGTIATSRRYSRYLTIYDEIENGTIPAPFIDYSAGGTATYRVNQTDGQWKAYHETGSKTCCGGGWIRKFADGTNDWTRNDRLTIAVENFQCLNYRNEYFETRPTVVPSANYGNDLNTGCRESNQGGCPQLSFPTSNGFDITAAPELNDSGTSGLVVTANGGGGVTVAQADFISFNTKASEAFVGEDLIALDDIGSGVFAPTRPAFVPRDSNDDQPYLTPGKCAGIGTTVLTYKIPSYIHAEDGAATNPLVAIGMRFSTEAEPSSRSQFDTVDISWQRNTGAFGAGVRTGSNTAIRGTASTFRIDIDYTNYQIDISCNLNSVTDFAVGFPYIEFVPQNTTSFNGLAAANLGSEPGSDTYYLTKLGRLELLGIPQIHYEPLYCNSDSEALVPGIYSSFTTQTQLEANALSVEDTTITTFASSTSGDNMVVGEDNPNKFVSTIDDIALSDVFSADEFICCTPLGTNTVDKSKCCSGHARAVDDSLKCAIPSGTNLHVYFNRYVSGEGQLNTDTEPNGLINDDFNDKTGEPKMRQSTYDKINALGQKYCDNEETDKVRNGGAFGEYFPEPTPGDGQFIAPDGTSPDSLRIYSIIDSIADTNSLTEKGFNFYDAGFKWNHHQYCK